MEFNIHKYGFIRIAVASPELRIANVQFNVNKHIEIAKESLSEQADILLFPELSITAYSCADLFYQRDILDSAIEGLKQLVEFSKNSNLLIIAGVPIQLDNKLFNCAAIIQNGHILGLQTKTFIPNSLEFYEKRWFSSGYNLQSTTINLYGNEIPIGNDILFEAKNYPLLKIGVEICEDLWAVKPVSSDLAVAGASVLLNLSASNEFVGKMDYRRSLVSGQSGRTNSIYVYAAASAFESTTDLLFSGHCMIAENGGIIAESERMELKDTLIIQDCDFEKVASERLKNSSYYENLIEKDHRIVQFELLEDEKQLKRVFPQTPFVPQTSEGIDKICKEIIKIQSTALARRLLHINSKKVVIGLSGGLDSTLALLVIYEAFEKLGYEKDGIFTISMPGFGTSKRTKNNAEKLALNLGANFRSIDITKSTNAHFHDIDHSNDEHNLVFENAQARRRTHILMDLANKYQGIVVGTGDLSEIALGWSTFNADHISMYNVNSSIPKTLVKTLIKWYAEKHFDLSIKEILYDIIDTPISPELLPTDVNGEIQQQTESIIGPFILHDFFLYYFIRYGFSREKILKLAQITFQQNYSKEEIKTTLDIFYERFYQNQFKRSVFSDGIKVGTVSLSPRGDWRMPSDADY